MAVAAPPVPPARPPHVVAWRWAHANLFSTPANSVLTVVTLAFIIFASYQVARFVLVTAEWEVIEANRGLFMLGRFPREEVWRVWFGVHLAGGLGGFTWGLWSRVSPRLAGAIALLLLPVYIVMLEGDALIWTSTAIATFAGGYGLGFLASLTRAKDLVRTVTVFAWLAGFVGFMAVLTEVSDRLWGGLLLTMILSIVSIVVSFPLGVALAVGRASTFPVVRAFCVGYIELIRGVPLITVLFMSMFVLPLAIEPQRDVLGIPLTGMSPSVVVRAMVGLILFTAAYVAEIVRGGLQAVPRGQVEAAQALGLGGLRILSLIVLPQALRAVIPALVGQFISLYKDTSLVFILGLTDLLRVARIASAQPDFIGHQAETLLFVALIYWIVCFAMSRASQRLERNLGVGER